jgi:hypothetical protein
MLVCVLLGISTQHVVRSSERFNAWSPSHLEIFAIVENFDAGIVCSDETHRSAGFLRWGKGEVCQSFDVGEHLLSLLRGAKGIHCINRVEFVPSWKCLHQQFVHDGSSSHLSIGGNSIITPLRQQRWTIILPLDCHEMVYQSIKTIASQ